MPGQLTLSGAEPLLRTSPRVNCRPLSPRPQPRQRAPATRRLQLILDTADTAEVGITTPRRTPAASPHTALSEDSRRRDSRNTTGDNSEAIAARVLCRTASDARHEVKLRSASVLTRRSQHLTRHKISCREPCVHESQHTLSTADTPRVNGRLARGQLHRLVRWWLLARRGIRNCEPLSGRTDKYRSVGGPLNVRCCDRLLDL